MVANYFLPRLLAILLAILSSSIFAAPHFSSSTTHTPLVDTPYGQYKPNIVDKQHHFFAIPYAQPPINELRFRAPQPLLTQKEQEERDKERVAYNRIVEYNGRHYFVNDKLKEKSVLGNDTPALRLEEDNLSPAPPADKRIETLKKIATNMASIENVSLSSTTTPVANIVSSASPATTLLGDILENIWKDDSESESESEASSEPSMLTPSIKIKFVESATSQSPSQVSHLCLSNGIMV